MPKTKSKSGRPPAAEFGLLNAYLARSGVGPTERKAAIGISPSGRTRDEIWDGQFCQWLRSRPKKGRAKKVKNA